MRKAILFLMLLAFFGANFEFAQATTYYNVGIGRSNFNRCKYGHRHNHGLNPFNRFNRGVITGFSPPVNYSYSAYPNSYYNSNPFSLNNSFGIKNKFKRIFRPYNNNPFYNTYNYPYSTQNQIQIFDSSPNNFGGHYINNNDLYSNTSSNGGVGVTIIE